MIDPREIPEAVLWHEGMLLAPQHFQEAAHRAEALLAYRLAAACPYPWGIARLAIDRPPWRRPVPRRRARGRAAGRAAGAAPAATTDRRARARPQGRGAGPARDGGAADRASRGRRARRGGDAPAAGRPATVRSRAPPASTRPPAMAPIEIPRLVPAPDAPARRRARPAALAALGQPAAGAGRVPRRPVRARPLLRPAAAGRAGHRAARRRRRGRRAAAREGGGAGRAAAGAGHGPRRRAAGWEAVQALARGLPRLEALLASGRAHPFDVFLALADIVGNLTGRRPPALPAAAAAVRARRPLPAYAPGSRADRRGRGRACASPTGPSASSAHGDGRFTLELPAGLADGELILGVRAGPGAAPAAVSAWLETGADRLRLAAARDPRAPDAGRAAARSSTASPSSTCWRRAASC